MSFSNLIQSVIKVLCVVEEDISKEQPQFDFDLGRQNHGKCHVETFNCGQHLNCSGRVEEDFGAIKQINCYFSGFIAIK